MTKFEQAKFHVEVLSDVIPEDLSNYFYALKASHDRLVLCLQEIIKDKSDNNISIAICCDTITNAADLS